ncbi:MAG: chorismate mutase [Scytonema sp. PMC 1069.18]|nr:chorismate mutase [Scytonema sp. PMC 1069.18]MEC4883334.1 chorismate mutase [Scytonema sp. PMC 1070.18]
MDKLSLIKHQHNNILATPSQWRVRGLRGATTVSQNTKEAIAEAVNEMLDTLETKNLLDPTEIASVTFSATPDLDAMFPTTVARRRPGWDRVPLLDVQQMRVVGSLDHCIRVLIHLNTPLPQNALHPVYLRRAAQLRPDLALVP